jgi:hypothetical protein
MSVREIFPDADLLGIGHLDLIERARYDILESRFIDAGRLDIAHYRIRAVLIVFEVIVRACVAGPAHGGVDLVGVLINAF